MGEYMTVLKSTSAKEQPGHKVTVIDDRNVRLHQGDYESSAHNSDCTLLLAFLSSTHLSPSLHVLFLLSLLLHICCFRG